MLHVIQLAPIGSPTTKTADGLLQYAAGQFHRYAAADGLPSSDITSLATSEDGSLYILAGNGVARFDGKSSSPLPISSPSSPSALSLASDDSVVLSSVSAVF